MPTTQTVVVRHVALSDRTEWHAEACAHRIPSGAEVEVFAHTAADIAEVHAEAIELNDGPSPIKPCLRKTAR